MNGLLKSRKFWLLVLDTVVSVSGYFITKYAAPEMANDALFMIGALQPVFVALIAAIAYEDAAEKRATVLHVFDREELKVGGIEVTE